MGPGDHAGGWQENVRAEKVMVPKWVRGKEYCELVEPRVEPISMLGLEAVLALRPRASRLK